MKRNTSAAKSLKPRRANHREQTGQAKVVRIMDAEATYYAASALIGDLPPADNAQGALEKMLRANGIFRNLPWPVPFDETTHRLHLGDARDLSWIPDASVHLIVTSPPYWTLKDYAKNERQLGEIADYEAFLSELDKVWSECSRVLVPGGVFAVLSETCVFRGSARGGTTSCRYMQIFRSAPVDLVSTASHRFSGRRSPMASRKPQVMGLAFTESHINRERLSRTTSNTFCFCGRVVSIGRHPRFNEPCRC